MIHFLQKENKRLVEDFAERKMFIFNIVMRFRFTGKYFICLHFLGIFGEKTDTLTDYLQKIEPLRELPSKRCQKRQLRPKCDQTIGTTGTAARGRRHG